ncbi:DapH/DapD/GlmU-related protein [Fundidesulfovibrio terrae]|uniref:DapH/DapD/GlmU-related protein n=1 Tax=Fundidesulfovibrio terrae TaxID=2922866 RepID=UPI001FAE75D0|nr:DapH/DapD/GlmU-related protein [Fundidesulfovibrio terrae]
MANGLKPVEDLSNYYSGVSFGHNVQLVGMKNIVIGEGTTVADDSWLNVCVRDEEVRMIVGRNCYIGRRAVFNTAGRLELGDYCLLAPGVYIADADHVYADITRPYVEQGVSTGRSVTVEENCWLGIGTVITGNLTVGRGAIVAAGAVVLADVAPFSIVGGVPARILKLYNPATKEWESASAPEDMERIILDRQRLALPSREEYVSMLRKNSALRKYDPVLTGGGQCL